MKHIFFMSPCRCSAYGFIRLVENIPGHTVGVIPVSGSRQVLQHMSRIYGSLHRQIVIVVDLAHRERTVLAQGLWFLWNLSVLYSEGRMPRWVPCVLLGEREVLDDTAYLYACVSPAHSVARLRTLFLKVLVTPAPWCRGMYGFKHLSDKERQVINSCLKGMSLGDIAADMGLTYREVSAVRQSANKKIGLRSRNEYALLMGRSFL